MKVVNGTQLAEKVLKLVKSEVESLDFRPSFCDVVVGSDPVALSYVKVKARKAKDLGIDFKMLQLPENSTTEDVIQAIQNQQEDPNLCGLIVQLPLPERLDKTAILKYIRPELDVDCLGQSNLEAFYEGHPRIFPPTIAAILEILDSLNLDLKNKKFLVIGQGELVGKPLTHLLKTRGFDVVTADKSTIRLKNLTQEADIIISAAGVGGLVKADMIKAGAILIDAGTSESAGSIVGDIDPDVSEKAAVLAPVPGGVGPLTVAKLFENAIRTAKHKH